MNKTERTSMADGDGDFRVPSVDYRDYDKDPEHFTEVRVDIPGLKKKFTSPVASNAEIDLQVQDRTLCLNVRLTNSGKRFRYEVNQLPDPVTPVSNSKDGTYFKVKRNDEVVLYLHKEMARRWNVQLDSIGLETAGHN